MKPFTFAFLTILLFASFTAQAQAPQAFKYQAVVRNAAGQVLANQLVGLKITLLGTGTPYVEVHSVTTNAFGLVNLEVGRGTPVSGNFSQINWAQENIFVQLALDATGGTNYQNMGTSELLSVPYALYAANSGSSGLPTDAQAGDMVYYDGTAWQRLPAGSTGLVLTMGADGKPFWKAPSELDFLIKLKMTNGDLIYVSPVNHSTFVQWGPNTDITILDNISTVAEANLDFNGEANTEAIVAQLGANNGTTYAAKICADLVAYGFDDWYLPAAGELNEIYQKLGPVGSQQIMTGYFWSSTERFASTAWNHAFAEGIQGAGAKGAYNWCRCVRK